MKLNKRLLFTLVFLFYSAFFIVSCEEEMVEEEITIETADAAALPPGIGPDAPDTPGELMFEAYYTYIRCVKESEGIQELKAYFKTREQCRCLTWKWEVENCNSGPGSQRVYNYCDKVLTSRRPYGALCQ